MKTKYIYIIKFGKVTKIKHGMIMLLKYNERYV